MVTSSESLDGREGVLDRVGRGFLGLDDVEVDLDRRALGMNRAPLVRRPVPLREKAFVVSESFEVEGRQRVMVACDSHGSQGRAWGFPFKSPRLFTALTLDATEHRKSVYLKYRHDKQGRQ
jgi:hypothetical protein